jgi:hypothetical protein
MEEAFDKTVLDMVKKDASFQEFLRKNYANLISQAAHYERNPAIRPGFRGFYIKAMRQYLNSRVDQRGEEKRKEDLSVLCRKVSGKTYDKLPERKDTADLELLSAMALYSWRNNNRNKPGAEWAYETKVLEREEKAEEKKPSRPVRR